MSERFDLYSLLWSVVSNFSIAQLLTIAIERMTLESRTCRRATGRMTSYARLEENARFVPSQTTHPLTTLLLLSALHKARVPNSLRWWTSAADRVGQAPLIKCQHGVVAGTGVCFPFNRVFVLVSQSVLLLSYKRSEFASTLRYYLPWFMKFWGTRFRG